MTGHAGWDLSSVIKRLNLNKMQIQFIVYQLLRGLKYLHSGDIVHRDLKPTNLALSSDCELTILDFELARKVSWEIMTEYVITRYYRAPEVICWSGKYDQKADMWSVGCIMAELITGKVLFKGSSSQEQFLLIIKQLGSPVAAFLDRIEADTSSDTRVVIENFGQFPPRSFSDVFVGIEPVALDFLEKILVLDPLGRLSVEDALRHEYMKSLHVPDDEPVIAGPVDFDEDSVARDDVTGWKRRIWREISECSSLLKDKTQRLIQRAETESEGSENSNSS